MAKRGRPVKENARRRRYELRMNDEEAELLGGLTKKTGMDRADVIRTALEKYNKHIGNKW